MKSFLQFLKRAYKYFRATKRVWRKPPQADLLIIDRGTASPLDEMFAHHNPHVLDIRGESVNMWALLRAVPKIHLGAVAYLEAYIDFVKPKLILSRNGDSSPNLWRLKRRVVDYKVALIQNGWRPDLYGAINISNFEAGNKVKPEIDVAFVFGLAQADDRLKNHANLVVGGGSTKLNGISGSGLSAAPIDIVFISQYRVGQWKDIPSFYDAEAFVCPSLTKFAKNHALQIHVAGAYQDSERSLEEEKWFSSKFDGANWLFHRMDNEASSYHLINAAKVVVTVDSTMGYEALALRRKVAFLSCRKVPYYDVTKTEWNELILKLGIETVDRSEVRELLNGFGAAKVFAETGFFWSNIKSIDEFDRVLNNVYSASPQEWERISRPIADQLMVHDYGSTKIRAYVESVLADSLENAKVTNI